MLCLSAVKHSSEGLRSPECLVVYTMLLLFAASPVTTVVDEPIETKIKVEVKTEEEEIGKKKKKRNIMWAADDMLVKYHYYEPDDEERGTIPSK